MFLHFLESACQKRIRQSKIGFGWVFFFKQPLNFSPTHDVVATVEFLVARCFASTCKRTKCLVLRHLQTERLQNFLVLYMLQWVWLTVVEYFSIWLQAVHSQGSCTNTSSSGKKTFAYVHQKIDWTWWLDLATPPKTNNPTTSGFEWYCFTFSQSLIHKCVQISMEFAFEFTKWLICLLCDGCCVLALQRVKRYQPWALNLASNLVVFILPGPL